jgi:hypothetical protein
LPSAKAPVSQTENRPEYTSADQHASAFQPDWGRFPFRAVLRGWGWAELGMLAGKYALRGLPSPF